MPESIQNSNRSPAPAVSVVSALYCSANHLPAFHSRLTLALSKLGVSYEIIFVNDGSPDNSLALALTLQRQDPHVIVVDLSRNFGQHRAQIVGLEQARGERIFLIESDLDEQPEWLVPFYEALASDSSVDVVYGAQSARRGGWFERLSGQVFYSLFNLMATVRMPENHITCRIMSRRYVRVLLSYCDRDLFLGGLYSDVGFKQKPFAVEKLKNSPTNYSLRKKILLAAGAIISFSRMPLLFVFGAGILIFTCSALAMLVLAYEGTSPLALAVSSIWLLGGVLMMSMGILGVYVMKTLNEAKQRPVALVREIFRND